MDLSKKCSSMDTGVVEHHTGQARARLGREAVEQADQVGANHRENTELT